MIREFPNESRAEIVMPRCSVCKRYMVRNTVRAKLGAHVDSRLRADGQRKMDILTVAPDSTTYEMSFICKKGHEIWNMPMSEIIELNKYPITSLKIVDHQGNEL